MKLMFASLEAGRWETIEDIAHLTKYLLSSYWYVRGMKKPAFWELLKQRNEEDNFLLDSGAFTLMETKNTDLHKDLDGYIDNYIEFVKKHEIKRYVEMDIDNVIGYEEVKRIREKLEREIGWQCVPVWHKNRGIEEWKKLVDEYDYIAFGGFNDPGNTGVKKRELGDVKKMIAYANSKNVKVHGLGFTGMDSWDYGFYSVDSSSWTVARRYGLLVEFTGDRIRTIPKQENRRMKDGTWSADRNNFIEWCKFQRYVEGKGYWQK